MTDTKTKKRRPRRSKPGEPNLKIGRPTKFSAEMVEKAWHYIENYADEQYGDVFPSAVGLAKVLQVAESTMYHWAEKEEYGFQAVLDVCKDRQKHRLLNGGLSGVLNSTITKLVLSKHGYYDKQENDTRHSFDFSNLSDEELKRIAGET